MTSESETGGPPSDTPKKDLRYTEHAEDNVRIERKLDGSGHLARGDKTRMSVLNFSSRHQARTERDPDFEFRPPPVPKPPAEPAPSPSSAAPLAAAEGGARIEGQPALEGHGTVLDKIKKILGL